MSALCYDDWFIWLYACAVRSQVVKIIILSLFVITGIRKHLRIPYCGRQKLLYKYDINTCLSKKDTRKLQWETIASDSIRKEMLPSPSYDTHSLYLCRCVLKNTSSTEKKRKPASERTWFPEISWAFFIVLLRVTQKICGCHHKAALSPLLFFRLFALRANQNRCEQSNEPITTQRKFLQPLLRARTTAINLQSLLRLIGWK